MEYFLIAIIGWSVNIILLLGLAITIQYIVNKAVSEGKNLERLGGLILLEKTMRRKISLRNELLDKGKSAFLQTDLIIFLPFSMILKIFLLSFSRYSIFVEMIADLERDIEILESRLES